MIVDHELTHLIARPRPWQYMQRFLGAALLVAGLWSLLYSVEPIALGLVAVGLWGTSEFWRGVRVTGDRMVAQGRVIRRTVPLEEFLQVGTSRARSVWVQSKGRRTLVLHMAERRMDEPGGIADIERGLRELAEEAGATLDPPLTGATRPPRPNTPFFGW